MSSFIETLINSQRTKTAIVNAGFAFMLFYADPLGISSQKAFAVDRFIAWFSQATYVSKAQNAIAVVLIDETTLADWRVDWPITYRKMAGIVLQLSCAHAAAIFFDFTPSKKYNLADGDAELLRIIRDSSTSPELCMNGNPPDRIPMFFGKTADLDTPLLRAIDADSGAFWIETLTNNDTYAAGRATFPEGPLASSDLTPAFGILRRLCGHLAVEQSEYHDFCPVDQDIAYSIRPIILRWSGQINPKQAMVSDINRCRGTLSVGELLPVSLGISEKEYYETCPPILTLTGSDLDRDFIYLRAC